MRSLFVTIVGLCACGDSLHPLRDAGPVDSTNPDAQSDGAVPPDAFVDTDTSLLLRYDFEDPSTATMVRDVSSKGKNGTLSDVAAWTADGRNGRGIKLVNGATAATTTQYVSIPSQVLAGVSSFTIATWVKFDQIADFARIFDLGNGPIPGATRWAFLTVTGGDGVRANLYGGGGPPSSDPLRENVVVSGVGAPTRALPTSAWKHIAVTGSAGVNKLYIDGALVATNSAGPDVLPSEMEPLGGFSWLGKSRFAADPGLNASLDDFRIYNRVFTDTEIADLAWPKKDYSYWRFDETAGTTAKDSSDNAVVSTLANGPTWVTGQRGNALDFAGGTGGNPDGPHVSLTTTPLKDCTTELTVATWVKLHAQDNWARVFDFGTGNTAFIYVTPFDDRPPPTQGDPNLHGMRFAMVSPHGAFDLFTATPPIPGDNTWHHIAVTVKGDDVTMYVDGAIILTGVKPSAILVSDFKATTENWFGRSRFPDRYLNGALDDLRISCRAYLPHEIWNLSRP
jgi:hypothetical protein